MLPDAPPTDDEELTRLALAADPDAPLPGDARPMPGWTDGVEGALPDWYMPPARVGASRVAGWRRAVAWLIVVSALAVVASGLCNTYGVLEIA